jgi:hypothetical protein
VEDVVKRKFLTLLGLELQTPQSSSPYPVAISTELSRHLTGVECLKFIYFCYIGFRVAVRHVSHPVFASVLKRFLILQMNFYTRQQ